MEAEHMKKCEEVAEKFVLPSPNIMKLRRTVLIKEYPAVTVQKNPEMTNLNLEVENVCR